MITAKTVPEKNVWELYLGSRPEANFLQSWWWGEFHTRIENSSLSDRILR